MVTQQRLTDTSHLTLRTRAIKRGEVLTFRPPAAPPTQPLVPRPWVRLTTGNQLATIITYGGQEFAATAAMAECFLARVRRVVDARESELVPLLHSTGIDLFLISATTPLGIRPHNGL